MKRHRWVKIVGPDYYKSSPSLSMYGLYHYQWRCRRCGSVSPLLRKKPKGDTTQSCNDKIIQDVMES